VGLAFLALALVAVWRGRAATATVLATPGILLALAGVVAPTHLGPVERAWMGLAHAMSRVTTPVAMGIIYFGVLTPVGLIRRALGARSLQHPLRQGSYWQPRTDGPRDATALERQF
jgi:hypothetical protein